MSRSGSSLLLIEDDADDQYFIARAFKQVGIEAGIEAVSDGQAAVEFFERISSEKAGGSTGPRLVLLDLNLPRKSGLEVLKWIRASQWQTVIVIVLTSSTSQDDMRRAYAHGANAYVLKPADPTKLRELAQLVKDFWLTWNQFPASLK